MASCAPGTLLNLLLLNQKATGCRPESRRGFSKGDDRLQSKQEGARRGLGEMEVDSAETVKRATGLDTANCDISSRQLSQGSS